MSRGFEFFKTSMPDTRKADFYLGCLDSSVFIDFNRLENDLVQLTRISFDGYGCCNLENKAETLTVEDSYEFIKQMESSNLNQEVMTRIVKNAIQLNEKHIWEDAIEEYGLL